MPLSATLSVTVPASHAARSRDLPSGIGVLGRIRQEVREHLGHTQRIGRKQHALGWQVDRQHVALRIDCGTCGLHRSADDGGEICHLGAQLQGAPRDTRDIEQIVEQQRHLPDLAIDDFVAPALLRLGRRRRLGNECRLSYGSKGIAQLVRERREKFILAPIGLAQRRFRRFAMADFRLCSFVEARVVDCHRSLCGHGQHQALRPFRKNVGLGMTEEKPADDLLGARHHRNCKIAADRERLFRHSVVR